MSLNKVTLLGNLTLDPEMKDASTGKLGCLLTLATDESWTDKSGKKQERTEYHRVIVWGKLAESCGLYLKKGERALIEGAIHTRSWEDKGVKKYITEIVASGVYFMGNTAKTEKDAMETRATYQTNSKPATKFQPKPPSGYKSQQNRY